MNDEYKAKSKLFDVNVIVVKMTEKAALVEGAFRDTGEPVWLPRSQIELSDNGDGTLQLTAPEWLLREKGFL